MTKKANPEGVTFFLLYIDDFVILYLKWISRVDVFDFRGDTC